MKPLKKTAAKTKLPPKQPEWDDTAAVDAFLKQLDHPLKPVMAAIRTVILGADQRITEGIKWNAPSFYFHGWFATFNVRGLDTLLIVFHQGAKVRNAGPPKIKDPAGLLKWLGKDRCIARFSSVADVKSRKAALASIVQQWVGQMPAEPNA